MASWISFGLALGILLADPVRAEATGPDSESDENAGGARAEVVEVEKRLAFSGDFRLRYETNSSFYGVPSWDRGVLRGRLAAKYKLNDFWSLGARLVTGDPDNPRTTDVSIRDFKSDPELSLDMAYVAYRSESLLLTGGQFAKPFSSTELVWDGDVNPEGLGGQFSFGDSSRLKTSVSGIWFTFDDPTLANRSEMYGGQLGLKWQQGSDLGFSVSAAYYDYDLSVLNPASLQKPRGNNLTPDGATFLSDFELFDVVATAEFSGLGENWPLRVVADSVINLGSAVPEDRGWGIDIFAGHLGSPGRFMVRYGYAQVETDAVLGLFSNDNIILATNYKLHTLSVDYRISEHTFVGLTEYVFDYLDAPEGSALLNNDWGSRTRLNLYFQL